MKFRKTIFVQLIAVMLLLGAQNVMADGVVTDKTSDNVTLNIKLHKIQSIIVNPAAEHKTVTLEYSTIENYDKGVEVEKEDHLTVYSTGGFEVKAASQSPVLTGPDSNLEIDIADVLLSASKGSSNNLDNYTFSTDAALTQNGTYLIKNSEGGNNINFNIKYKAAGRDAYINHYVKGEDPTVYTTTVTYTIAPI